jgi:hypothetical protein
MEPRYRFYGEMGLILGAYGLERLRASAEFRSIENTLGAHRLCAHRLSTIASSAHFGCIAAHNVQL